MPNNMPHTNKDQGGVEEIVLNWLKEEEKDNYVKGTLETSYTLDGIFDLSILVDSLHQELQKAREEQGKRYITLMNQALGETELPEDVWKKIAKVNQLILDK